MTKWQVLKFITYEIYKRTSAIKRIKNDHGVYDLLSHIFDEQKLSLLVLRKNLNERWHEKSCKRMRKNDWSEND